MNTFIFALKRPILTQILHSKNIITKRNTQQRPRGWRVTDKMQADEPVFSPAASYTLRANDAPSGANDAAANNSQMSKGANDCSKHRPCPP